MLRYSSPKLNTGWIHIELYKVFCTKGSIKAQGSFFAAAEANSHEILGRAGGCLPVSLSLSAHPALSWAALLARHRVDPSQKPSEPLHNWIRIFLPLQCWVSGLVGGNPCNPHPAHLLPATTQRPCARASEPRLSARPHHWPSWHGPDQLDLL